MALILWNGGTYSMECLVTLTVEGGNINVEYSIAKAELKTEIKRRPKAFITAEEIKAIQSKQYLTLKEAAILLNITPLTLRRWTLDGKVNSQKVGKKHLYMRENLF